MSNGYQDGGFNALVALNRMNNVDERGDLGPNGFAVGCVLIKFANCSASSSVERRSRSLPSRGSAESCRPKDTATSIFPCGFCAPTARPTRAIDTVRRSEPTIRLRCLKSISVSYKRGRRVQPDLLAGWPRSPDTIARRGGMTKPVDPSARRLITALEQHLDSMVELLGRVARVESPSEDPAAISRVHDLLERELLDLGFKVRRIAGRRKGGLLLAYPATRRRGAPLQLLLGHCDTVWPLGTLDDMPVHIRSGRMMGPGVYDMKGGLIQMLLAFRGLRTLGHEPEVTPVLLINSLEGFPSTTPAHQQLSAIRDRASTVA